MRKQAHSVPAVKPAFALAARRMLALTRRAWRAHPVPRPDLARLPPDERVRCLGEW